MNRRKPALPLLALTLALAATGLAGCKKSTPGQPAEAQKNAQAPASAQTQGQTPSAATAPGAAPAGMPPAGMPSHETAAAEAKPVDPSKLPDVVARINGVEVKKDQLLKEANDMRRQLAQTQGIQAPLNASFYKQVLDGIVARTLLTEEAKEQKVTVSDAEVEQQMAALRSQARNPEAFKQALAANGLTEASLRQRIKTEGAVQKLVQTKVLAGVTVSDQAAKEFYDKNQDKMKRPERVHVRHILIRADASAPAADRQKAKAKADDLLKRVQKGEDFAKLASENSDDPGSKVQGGDLPPFTHGEMVPAFDRAAFALTKPNELSPVVESQFGYHIIQLVGKEPSAVAPFEEVKGQIAEYLKRQQSQQALAAHVQGLKAKGKVETYI
jgi:peptidyl-prolyl cis-trans isomerase C